MVRWLIIDFQGYKERWHDIIDTCELKGNYHDQTSIFYVLGLHNYATHPPTFLILIIFKGLKDKFHHR
jgi:hypothetical protein